MSIESSMLCQRPWFNIYQGLPLKKNAGHHSDHHHTLLTGEDTSKKWSNDAHENDGNGHKPGDLVLA